MPVLLPRYDAQSQSQSGIINPSPFPAITRQAAGLVAGTPTDVMSIGFADKIMVTITQSGKVAQWIHVPLDTANPTYAEHHLPTDVEDGGLLPMPHLTPTTILGGTLPEMEVLGQVIASQIASAVATRRPEESRLVVVGLGLARVDGDLGMGRVGFYDLVELVEECL